LHLSLLSMNSLNQTHTEVFILLLNCLLTGDHNTSIYYKYLSSHDFVIFDSLHSPLRGVCVCSGEGGYDIHLKLRLCISQGHFWLDIKLTFRSIYLQSATFFYNLHNHMLPVPSRGKYPYFMPRRLNF